MSLLRFLGLSRELASERPARAEAEVSSVRQIAAKLERLDPDAAKYLATFAYVLTRVAYADLNIDEAETAEMERRLTALASLSPEEVVLVVEIAKSQNRMLGGTENYVVTREFRRIATREQCHELLSVLYAVAAADGSISAAETTEIAKIAEELGFTRAESIAVRATYRDKLAVLKDLPGR